MNFKEWLLSETRQGFLKYLKEKLPLVPEYVLFDLFYRNIKNSKPEEIDAQVDGFKRMRDITKRPFEELVRNWFRTHKDIHQMDTEDQSKIIKMIMDYYRNS